MLLPLDRDRQLAPPSVHLRPLTPDDLTTAEVLLDEVVAGRLQVRRGEMVDVLAHHGVGAWDGNDLVGVVSWIDEDDETAELAVLAVRASHRGRGLGGRLVDAVVDAAGSRRVWLVTTNDNLTALTLYQRRGFRLAELHAGAIDAARERKPTIPERGDHGIPLHDELVLERGPSRVPAGPRLVTVVLEVADLDRSLSLYRDGFGLDLRLADHQGGGHGEGDRWISGRHAAHTWTDGAFLHVALYEAKGAPTTGAQLSFTVTDLDRAHARAVEAGASVLHDPRQEPWGTSARYLDPDGNVVELTEPQ